MIHRNDHTENFTVLSNALIRDDRLSDLKTKSIYLR